MNWKALVLGAAIAIAGVATFAYISNDNDSIGDKAGEAVEEVGDEIDDRS